MLQPTPHARAPRARAILRYTSIGIAALVALALTAATALALVGYRRERRVHPVPDVVLHLPSDSVSLARGAHIARSIGTCTLCHGPDLAGAVYMDAGALGLVVGPNLTRGRGGIAEGYETSDWVRAIRYGVHRDGTSLAVMPSEVFVHLGDRDLAALIAYLRELPAVDRELPATRLRWLGKILLATGRLPILVAEKTPRPARVADVAAGESIEYGRYLADVAGCTGCHGHGLSGGRVAGPPGLPPASNLTPAGDIARWSETDFFRAMREGVRPDGRAIDDFMPWRQSAGMTDGELRALLAYLRSVPARETGLK